MQTYLSGIQPSGRQHLGNYFGAIRQHVALAGEEGEHFYFIADYHALTTSRDPAELRECVQDTAVTYLALGLDPARCALFRQSDVPEVCELTWLLACVTGMGLLERAHSYKDKLAHGIKPSVGLFTYPVLMAADILAYDSTRVACPWVRTRSSTSRWPRTWRATSTARTERSSCGRSRSSRRARRPRCWDSMARR
jgi:tryptophanyl-tRNA synthetase